MTARASYTDLLCVHCPQPLRQQVERRLRAAHAEATLSALDNGWLVVEHSIGSPAGPLVGSALDVRFALGEHELLGPRVDLTRVSALARITRENPDGLSRLPGDFSFVVLGEHGHASAVRSCSGAPRILVFSAEGVTVVGTRLEWVARLFPRTLTLNTLRLACDARALGIAPLHGSAITGITIVPVGHVAHVGRWETPRLVRYWRPETLAPVQLTADELAAELERRLTAELTRHLDDHQSNAVLFSGGVDSSLLAGLCSHLGAPLSGATILPPAHHPALSRERYYTRLLASKFDTHLVRHHEPDWLLQTIADHPGALHLIGASEWLLLGSLTNAPRTVVSGWFADECFGHLRWPELFRTAWPRWRALLRACSATDAATQWYRRRRAGRSPFHTEGWSPPPLFAPAAVRDFDGWFRATTWTPRPEPHAERLLLYRRLTDIAGSYADAASHFGARIVAPFASRAVVELAVQTDPAQLFEGRLAKVPLRRIGLRYLPHALALRPDKGDWGLPFAEHPRPPIPDSLSPVLDMDYLQAHPTLSLDEVGILLCITALERGRARIENDRRAIWNP